jgi:hypothetical protein
MFEERQPVAFAHEELGWQSELARRGVRVYFEPRAVVQHFNRPGFRQLLRRNYRWAYSSIESKHETGATRVAWLFRYPVLPILAAPVLGAAQSAYIVGEWIRVGRLEPLLFAPMVVASRAAYVAGMVAGGVQWMRGSAEEHRPRWE